jgi:DNA-binding transcriptional LysR family regulator
VLEEVTLASPGYIEMHGRPRHPSDLRQGHLMVGFHSSATGGVLPLEFTVDGKVSNFALPSVMSVTAAETYYAAAVLGFGLIQVPRYHAEADLHAGHVVELLADYPPTGTPVSVLYPRNRQLSPRVRVFIDWLTVIFEHRSVR